MAKRFPCAHCGSPIITQHLKVSESAYCRACGKYTPVPAESEAVPDEMAAASHREGTGGQEKATPEEIALEHRRTLEEWNVHPTVRLYSKRAIFTFALLTTVFVGGLLAAANWRRLGRPERSRNTLWVTGGISALIFVLAAMTPEHSGVSRLFAFVNVALAYSLRTYVQRFQGPVLNALKSTGREPAPVRGPAAIAVVATLAVVAMMILIPEEPAADKHTRSGLDLIERGQLDSALFEFHQARVSNPTDWLNNALIGECFAGLEQPESAAYYLETSLTTNPAFGEAHLELGIAYAQLERYRDSWREFQFADSLGIEVEPGYYEFLQERIGEPPGDTLAEESIL